VDENGKTHFPNHAEVSAQVWKEATNSLFPVIENLIRMDMKVHTMCADDIPEFCKNREAVSLLYSALAEIHANAELFGGIESISFKIKYKQVEKRGAAILKHLV
jgi:hypothetical protein